MSDHENDQAEWGRIDPDNPYFGGLARAYAARDAEVWALAPLRCPECGRRWFYYFSLHADCPSADRERICVERQAHLKGGTAPPSPGYDYPARAYRCDDCWTRLRDEKIAAAFAGR
jgi:hypothetical protein